MENECVRDCGMGSGVTIDNLITAIQLMLSKNLITFTDLLFA